MGNGWTDTSSRERETDDESPVSRDLRGGACEGEMISCFTGGEELMLLLTDIMLAMAMAKAEEIRNAVAGLAVPYGDTTLPPFAV